MKILRERMKKRMSEMLHLGRLGISLSSSGNGGLARNLIDGRGILENSSGLGRMIFLLRPVSIKLLVFLIFYFICSSYRSSFTNIFRLLVVL